MEELSDNKYDKNYWKALNPEEYEINLRHEAAAMAQREAEQRMLNHEPLTLKLLRRLKKFGRELLYTARNT